MGPIAGHARSGQAIFSGWRLGQGDGVTFSVLTGKEKIDGVAPQATDKAVQAKHACGMNAMIGQSV